MRLPFLRPKANAEHPRVETLDASLRAASERAAEAAATRAVSATQESMQARVDAAMEKAVERAMASFVSGGNGVNVSEAIGVPKRRQTYLYDNPWVYAIPQAPYRRAYNQITLQTLRIIADTYDPARSCINHLKRETETVPINIVKKGMKANQKLSPADEARIGETRAFFEKRGGLGGRARRRNHFESELFEDLLVIGAGAVWLSPTRGGGIDEAIAIDAATIQPVRDPYGWYDPKLAWRQWVMGVPVKEFREEELIYDGLLPTTNSPYFKSPLEFLVFIVTAGLKVDEWNRVWLTEGTTPADKMALPDDWTFDQFMEYVALYAGDLAGNIKKRVGTKFYPGGSKDMNPPTRKDQDFEGYQAMLIHRTCSILGVSPASIGYSDGQYKVSQEDSMDATSDFGVGALLEYRKALYDDLLFRLGYEDLETVNVQGRQEEALERARRIEILVRSGAKTPNEARAMEGDDPLPGGDALFISNQLTPIELALNPPAPVAPGGAATKGEGRSGSGSDSSSEGETDAKRVLRQWERKALNRLKSGKSAACPFETDALTEDAKSVIEADLKRCRTAEEVRALFEKVVILDADAEIERLVADFERMTDGGAA